MAVIAEQIVKEIRSRLQFLSDVGLSYLTLSRASGTLSGGESQRIRLATQIGSSLMGVLYILDEPSIGLHQRDNDKLLGTLKHLRDIGNTLIVVEHDEDTMRAADFIVDVGPGAGINGGQIVAAGTCEEIMPPVDLAKKFEAFGFQVWQIDGNDMEQVVKALDEAMAAKNGLPKCIVGKTVKGNGVSYMENQCGWHGVAPNAEQYRQAMEELDGQYVNC